MRLRVALCSLLLASGCVRDKGPPPVEADAAPAPPPPPVQSAAPKPPLSIGPAPASSARKEREARVLAVLSGEVVASALPEVATEPGEGLDLDLREELSPRKKSKVELASVETEGAMGAEPARRALEAVRARLAGCYARGLAGNPSLAGQVRGELSVAAGGRITASKTAATDLPAPGVVRCIMQRSEAASFPSSDAGSTLVRFVLRLSPD